MTKPLIAEFDSITGETITREMNAIEFAAYKENQNIQSEIAAADEANATAKSALLNRLGLTADEAKLLLS